MKQYHANNKAGATLMGSDFKTFEEILACNIKDVIGDLCLADADIIMSYVRDQLHGNMNEIVTASTELYFKEKTLSYGHAADINFEWGHPASIVLNMEFAHGPVSIMFQLVLGSTDIGVRIVNLALADGQHKALFGALEFAQVLRSARRTPVPLRYAPCPFPEDATWH